MAINLKKIGHITAIILIITGLLVVWIGQNMIESDFVRNNGLIGVMVVVLGILFMLGGALLTIITFISWVFGTLTNRFGFKAVFLAIGIIGLSFYVYKLFVPSGSFIDPIPVGIIDGTIYSGPAFTEDKVKVLKPNASIMLLRITDSIIDGYPWFQVAYNQSSKGYIWGGNLCAQEVWTNGLSGRCPSHQQEKTMTEVDSYNIDSSTKPIDIIEAIHKMLPGNWQSSTYSREFNEQKEIVYDENVIGRWFVEIDDNYSYNYEVWLKLQYNGKYSYKSNRYRISNLNASFLGLKKGLDYDFYEKDKKLTVKEAE